jgi:hypothetical protein
LNRYESDYCSYQAPSEWVPEPPFGFSEPGGKEGRMMVQLLEIWLASPRSAEDYAAQQKEALPHLLQEFDLVDEGPYQVEGARNGRYLRYRYFSDDGDTTIETRIVATQGPLLIEMTLTRLDEMDAEKERLLGAIAKTLTLRNTEFLAKTEPIVLLQQPEDERAERPDGPRLEYPQSCVSIIRPEGWEVSENDADVVLERSGATIRIRRLFGDRCDSTIWLKETMKELQGSGSALLASEEGELGSGASYQAILCDPGGTQRKWATAAESRVLLAHVHDQVPIEWSLRCPKETFTALHPVVQDLILRSSSLETERWQTKLVEAWGDLTLHGGWRSEGDGLYVNMDDGFIFLHLSALPSKVPLDHLSPSVVENVRGGFSEVISEDQALGLWRQMDSFRLSLEGQREDGQRVHVRTVWIAFDETIYSVMIQGNGKAQVDTLFTNVLDGLRIASASTGGG